MSRTKWERMDDGSLMLDADRAEIFVVAEFGGYNYAIYTDDGTVLKGDGYRNEAGAKAAALRCVQRLQ